MGRLNRLYPFVVIVLLAFYAVIGFYVLHPTVSPAYSQYYLYGDAVTTSR
jgi:hypothetical protein